MDRDSIKEELDIIFNEVATGLAIGAAAGVAAGRTISMAVCAKKFGRGTPEYKKCMSLKNTVGVKGARDIGKTLKKGYRTLRGKNNG